MAVFLGKLLDRTWGGSGGSESKPTTRRRCLNALKVVVATSGAILLTGGVFGQDPAWWSRAGKEVIVAGASPSNTSPATVGQGKWVVKRMLDELRWVLPDEGNAAKSEVALVFGSWVAPLTNAEKAAMRGPLLQGQLKAMTAPIYDQLFSAAPAWLEAEMISNSTRQSNYWTSNHYPWGADVGMAKSQAPAAIGHLKAVSRLAFWADRESGANADTLPDLWEHVVVNASASDQWTSISQINAGNAIEAAEETGIEGPPDPAVPPDFDVEFYRDRKSVV